MFIAPIFLLVIILHTALGCHVNLLFHPHVLIRPMSYYLICADDADIRVFLLLFFKIEM